jgi:type I restriction enzyme S subunit
MGNEWPRYLFEDCMDAIIDYRGKTPKKTTSGIPLITAKIIKNGTIQPVTEYIAESDYDSWMRRGMPETGDVVLTTEAPLGEVAQLDDRKIALAQRVITLRGKKGFLDNTFLRYLLLSTDVQHQLDGRGTGTTVKGIKQSELRKVELPIPDFDIQKKIAHILVTLDNKIQLNRQTNQTLEQMAQALFNSWFVDFDPIFDNAISHNLANGKDALFGIPEQLLPHAQRRLNVQNTSRTFHYLFPKEFEQSDEPSVGIQGRLPKGWRIEKIGDVIENVGGGTPKTKEDAYWIDGTHAFCTPKDMSSLSTKVLLKTERHLTDFGVSKVSSGVLDVGTVIMSSRAPIGYLAITKTPTTVNQGIIAMKPNDKYSSEYILCWSEVNQEKVVARANGSTFLEISKKNFREIPFVEPTDDCAKKFGILAKEYFDRIEILSKENKQLESLRDTLLPKLISGELRIPDTEAQVEEAI